MGFDAGGGEGCEDGFLFGGGFAGFALELDGENAVLAFVPEEEVGPADDVGGGGPASAFADGASDVEVAPAEDVGEFDDVGLELGLGH